jgi:hypothetical protein
MGKECASYVTKERSSGKNPPTFLTLTHRISCIILSYCQPSNANNLIYFNNLRQELNSLLRYDTAQNYRTLHRVIQHLCQQNLKISHHHHI